MIKTIWAVAKVEWLLLLRDKRFALAGIFLWLLVGLVLKASQSQFVVEQQQLRKAQKVAREQWQTRQGQSGHSLGHYGTYVYRQSIPLALLHPGAEPYVGVAAHIVAHQQTNLFYPPMLDKASLHRWADTSVCTILQIVVPLLLLALSFASIAGDREDGRWQFFLSQGASPTAFALGKLLSVVLTAGVLLLPTLLTVVVLIAQAANNLGDTYELWLRLLLILAGYSAVYCFFLALGITVSALSATRQSALFISVGAWALFCLIMPRLLSASAEIRFPTREADEIQTLIDAERKDRKASRTFVKQYQAEVMHRYKVKRAADLPLDLEAVASQAGEEFVNRINDRHMGVVKNQLAAQENDIVWRGGFLSPKVVLSDFGEKLSGTDPATLRQHVTAIENFRREWMYRLNDADAHRRAKRREQRNAKAQSQTNHTQAGRLMTQQEPHHTPWASFPAFHHQTPALSSFAPQIFGALAKLWGWAIISVLTAVLCICIKSGANRVLS